VPHSLSENSHLERRNLLRTPVTKRKTSRHVCCSKLSRLKAQSASTSGFIGETTKMASASTAVISSAHPAGTPRRVLPCNSPLRSIPGIDRVSRARIYSKGAVVFREGNAALGVYLLSTGRAKISISSADGKKLILRIARSGDILGLYAGLTGRPFEATAEMVEGGRVDFITRRDLLSLIERQNGWGLNLL